MSEVKQTDQTYKALIMVVDDNPEFLSGIELTLEMEGYKVWTALNGQYALGALKEAFEKGRQESNLDDAGKRYLPDLILADIMMPIMDGYALYEQTRVNPYLNHIPLIFLTAKSNDEDIRYGKGLGVDDYLSKLAPTEDLLASIQGKLKRVKRQQLYADLGQRHSQQKTRSELRRNAGAIPSVGTSGERMFSLKVVISTAVLAFILGWFMAVGWMGVF